MEQNNFDLAKKIDAALGVDVEISDYIKAKIIEAFCYIRPPEILEKEYHIRMIVLNDDVRNGGVSIKPGNITLNWKRLIASIPGIIVTTVGMAASPWIAVFSALIIWRDIYSSLKIELSPQHAIAMYTMWHNHDKANKISEEHARNLTNQALRELDYNELSIVNFAKLINELKKIGCIEIEGGEIWLREWIRRKWPLE